MIDNANNMAILKLWNPLLELLKSEHQPVVAHACWIIGTAVQNNPKAQAAVRVLFTSPSLSLFCRSTLTSHHLRSSLTAALHLLHPPTYSRHHLPAPIIHHQIIHVHPGQGDIRPLVRPETLAAGRLRPVKQFRRQLERLQRAQARCAGYRARHPPQNGVPRRHAGHARWREVRGRGPGRGPQPRRVVRKGERSRRIISSWSEA